MSDRASLSFDIDSSAAQRSVAVLQTLVQQSQATMAATQQLKSSTADLTSAYSQNRAELAQLSTATQAYGGTLQGLVGSLNALRTSLTGSTQDFQAYSRMINTAQGMAVQMNTSIEGIDRFVTKARELNVTSSDLATGLNRITDALKQQSAEGNQLRITMEQLGVTFKNIPTGRPDLVLQQLGERLRQYRDTAEQLRVAQMVMGPSFSAQDMMALERQPPPNRWTEARRERESTLQSSNDMLQANIQRQQAQRAVEAAELDNLATQFTTRTSFLGKLGLTGRGTFSSDKEQMQRLREIQMMPEDQREQHRLYDDQIARYVDQSGMMSWLRHVTTLGGAGAPSSFERNLAEIRATQQEERKTLGPWTALGNRFRNEWANLGNNFQPKMLGEDNRELSPFDQLKQASESAKTAGELTGDRRFTEFVGVQAQQENYQYGGTQQLFDRIYGKGPEAQRQRDMATQRVMDNTRYTRQPEQRLIDETSRSQYLRGLPREERERAEFNMRWYEQTHGVRAPVFPGQGLDAATQAGGTSEQGRREVEARQIALTDQNVGRRALQHEGFELQIQQQKTLAEALQKSRAAAEDANTAFSAYDSEFVKSGDHVLARASAEDALRLRLQQRITAGQELIRQAREETQQTLERATVIERGMRADPITRQAYSIAASIEQRRQSAVASGALPDAEGGSYIHVDPKTGERTTIHADASQAARMNADWAQQQFALQGAQGLEAAQTIRAGMQRGAEGADRVGQLVGQGVPLQQAQARVQLEHEFADQAAKGVAELQHAMTLQGEAGQKAMEAAEAKLKELDAQRQLSEALQRQQGIQQEINNLQERTRQLAEQTKTIVDSTNAPPWLRSTIEGLAEALKNLRNASAMPGGQVPSGGEGRPGGVYGVIVDAESGGRNVRNSQGPGGTPIVTSSGVAEGHYQITTGTWKDFAPKAGVNLNEFPTALSAPLGVQTRVASTIPLQRWDEKTQAAIRARYPTISMSMTLGQAQAAVGEPADPFSGASPSQGATGASATPGGGGTAQRVPSMGFNSDAEYREAYNRLAVGDLPAGWQQKSPQFIAELNDFGRRFRENIRAGQEHSLELFRDQINASITASRGRAAAAGRGPAEQARVRQLDPTLPVDLREAKAGEERKGVIEQQKEGYATSVAGQEYRIQQARERTQGLGETTAQEIERTRRNTAEQAAANQARAAGADVTNKQADTSRNLTEAYIKETESIQAQTKAMRDQIETAEAAAAASGGGPLAAQRAEQLKHITDQLKSLQSERAKATTENERNAIDAETDALNKQAAALDRVTLAQQRRNAGLQNYERGVSQRSQREQNSLSPFASDLERDRVRRYSALAEKYAQTKGLADSPEGKKMLDTERAQDEINQTTERMNELRGAAQGASSAIGQAFESVLTRSQTAGQAAKGLLDQLQHIAIQTFITKPFEKAMNSLFDSIFGSAGGGTPKEGSAGDYKGPGGSSYGILGDLLRGGSGSGGGGGGAYGSSAGQPGTLNENLDPSTGTFGGAANNVGSAAVQQLGSSGDGSSPFDQTIGSGSASRWDAPGGMAGSGGFSGSVGTGAGGAAAQEGPGLLGRIFGHAGGAIGWGVDKLGGEGFYKGGGLIGQMFSGSSNSGSYSYSAGQAGTINENLDATTGTFGGSAGADIGSSSGGMGFDSAGFGAGEVAYASGGVTTGLANLRNTVVDAPTVFRFAAGGRTGMAGEAGSEAILPLKRDSSGRLGVSAGSFDGGGGGGGDTHHHSWNISTQDAGSFMQHATQGQIANRMSTTMGKARQRNST